MSRPSPLERRVLERYRALPKLVEVNGFDVRAVRATQALLMTDRRGAACGIAFDDLDMLDGEPGYFGAHRDGDLEGSAGPLVVALGVLDTIAAVQLFPGRTVIGALGVPDLESLFGVERIARAVHDRGLVVVGHPDRATTARLLGATGVTTRWWRLELLDVGDRRLHELAPALHGMRVHQSRRWLLDQRRATQ